MTPSEIKSFLDEYAPKRERTLVIVDFGNVAKWNVSLKWKVGIQELGNLVKNLSTGNKSLRRFYYGEDCGPTESPDNITKWSKDVLLRAKMNGFDVVQKRVKYIHDTKVGLVAKCDLDVEMAVDLLRLQADYDHIVLFSGDGDLVYALRHLKNTFGKSAGVFYARGHLGKELVEAHQEGIIQKIFHADDFEYRLDMHRHKK